MPGALVVEGMRGLQVAFAKAERDERLGLRRELRGVAKPIAATAESLAVRNIKHVGPKWWKMRVGVTRTLVYVAPRQRGQFTKQNKARYGRPRFGTMLMVGAMEPALARHAPQIEARFAAVLDRVADGFNHGT